MEAQGSRPPANCIAKKSQVVVGGKREKLNGMTRTGVNHAGSMISTRNSVLAPTKTLRDNTSIRAD